MALVRDAWRRVWASVYFALAVSAITFCCLVWIIVAGVRAGDAVRWVVGLVGIAPTTVRLIGCVVVVMHRHDDANGDS